MRVYEKLTIIRIAEYNPLKINQYFPGDAFYELKNLVLTLGKNILKANCSVSDSPNKYQDVETSFKEAINLFFTKENNKINIIYYAAQLLQYYTIISDDAFSKGQNLQDFTAFLDVNKKKFGDITKNVFIVEYKLIKIYNDFCELTDSIIGKIAPIKNVEETAKTLHDELIALHSTVDEFKLNAPDYIFSHYLSFVINYSFAKALELEYEILKNTSSSSSVSKASYEMIQLSDIQKNHLAAAKEALDEIETLVAYQNERSLAYMGGIEFSFGQDTFSKLPHNFNNVKEHVNSLLISEQDSPPRP